MNPPTIKEELDRKALDTMDWFARKNAAGEISDASVRTAGVAVYMATAGLVDDKVQEVVVAATTHGGKQRTAVSKVFRDVATGGVAVVLSWTPGSRAVVVLTPKEGKVVEKENANEAKAAFDALYQRAAAKYEELAA